MGRVFCLAAPTLMAMYLPFCAADVRLTVDPPDAPKASLWSRPPISQGAICSTVRGELSAPPTRRPGTSSFSESTPGSIRD
jgi:hypothetical protein